jgi:UDP-N-acetylmuramoyl-tripeptide--D-alanyl-D-alanine ligase
LGHREKFNNHIGVPKTIAMLEDHHDIAIVEMGTNHPGEIKVLCDISFPTGGLITNIGDSHLEFFKERALVFEEKRVLFESSMVNTNGLAPFILCVDDPFLRGLILEKRLNKTRHNIVPFSFQTSSIDGVACVYCCYESSSGQVRLEIPKALFPQLGCHEQPIVLSNSAVIGQHNFSNLVAGFLLALLIYPKSVKAFIEGVHSFASMDNRSSWVTDSDGKRFYLDAIMLILPLEVCLRLFDYYAQKQ